MISQAVILTSILEQQEPDAQGSPLKEYVDTVLDEQDALGREAVKCYTALGSFR